ncbi:hypothetical protein Vadar_018246 [Vaccinium darrowii]|uniref:Uncharacterized protein n=1 Tax=Vaccinium darrowii TaxID=229202 RepID=A0ACB7X1U3_9ERIC|nr:hypothetical protein Vadar_018246 [Vaccinium darrowii]
MDAQEQTQIFTHIGQKVKMEAVEANRFDDEDQLTVSQILLSAKNPLDLPLNVVSDTPSRSESSKRGREIEDNFSDHFEVQSRVMARAEEVQASLAPEFPSFWRLMTRSHVTKGFWLGLPSELCKLHLPRLDAAVDLEDESGEKYNTKYLADRTALSGGWRGFSSAQKLLEGDAVVFHLVSRLNPIKFKVFIIRAKDFEVADALSLPNSDACAKEIGFGAYAEKNNRTCKKEKKKHPRLEIDNKSHRGDIHCSDASEGSKFSGSIPDIKNFNIVVNDLTIDFDLSTRVWTEYYDLCFTQKSYIHEGLLPTIDSKMAVGIISETINIANAIRACKISISPKDAEIWDKTLKAFVVLGMNVGFLRDRLNHLVSLSSELKEVSNRYAEASIERDGVQSELKSLELNLLGMKQERRRLDDEMEDLKGKAQTYEFLFQKEAIAPW